ncbi:MAG: hypothetical protein FJ276_14705, partial [Planctomycetes bacterium]|nr:hypothetical protein [Planctomycetota bacterium]
MRHHRPGRITAAAFLAATAASMPLLAQPPKSSMRAGEFRPPAPPILSALDANADGEISADEIENAVAALRNLDKDNNGEVASDELMPFGPGMGGPGGPMTRPRLEILEKFDVNKDGILRASERAEARKYAKDNRPAGGGPGFGGPGFGGPGF